MGIECVYILLCLVEVSHGTRLVLVNTGSIIVGCLHLHLYPVHTLYVDGVFVVSVSAHVVIILVRSKIAQMHYIGNVCYQVLLGSKSRVHNHLQLTLYDNVRGLFRSILPHAGFGIVRAIIVCIRIVGVLYAPVAVMVIATHALLPVCRLKILQRVERKAI